MKNKSVSDLCEEVINFGGLPMKRGDVQTVCLSIMNDDIKMASYAAFGSHTKRTNEPPISITEFWELHGV